MYDLNIIIIIILLLLLLLTFIVTCHYHNIPIIVNI